MEARVAHYLRVEPCRKNAWGAQMRGQQHIPATKGGAKIHRKTNAAAGQAYAPRSICRSACEADAKQELFDNAARGMYD